MSGDVGQPETAQGEYRAVEAVDPADDEYEEELPEGSFAGPYGLGDTTPSYGSEGEEEPIHSGEGARAPVDAVNAMRVSMKNRSVDRSVPTVLKDAGHYMLLGPPGFDLLYRMQYSVADEEWQPRLCVPEGQELLHKIPGQGQVPLGCRQRVLLERHNSQLAGHPGRDAT